ncbi:MAG: nitrogenase iron-molybdenum protein subunit alpha [Clostridiales bacterium]|nr:nitrogenase iron-molybdenum protein subunit alpha [Clostridiales bacterium]
MENYYNQPIPPVRDQRLQIADSFHGCGCNVSDCSKSGCMLRNNRSFWQTNACQMSLSLMMCATVENAVIIIHGPIGCGTQLHNLSSATTKGKADRGLTAKPVPWLSTNLQEAEVITGGEKKLKETIAYADRTYRPEIIFVVSTCAPNIIGDDVEQIVEQASREVAAQVTAIHCPGFKSRVVASAYDSFYHSLIRHIGFQAIPYKDFTPAFVPSLSNEIGEKSWNYKVAHTVNLFNATSIGPSDEAEMARLLNALDLNVQIYAEYSNADKFRLIPQAALNVSLCNMHDDYMLSYLEREYHMPYVIAGMPIGPVATRKWLLEVASRFDLQERANRFADEEEKLLADAVEPYLPKLKGKKVLLGGGSVRVAAESIFLKSLGMEIVGLRGYNYDSNADPVFDDLAKELPDVPVAISNQAYEFVNQVKTYQPDLIITHNGSQQIPAKLGVPSIQLFDVGGSYFGYNGAFQLVRKMIFALENDHFQKNLAKHAQFPYKESWYEKDPFTYHKEG